MQWITNHVNLCNTALLHAAPWVDIGLVLAHCCFFVLCFWLQAWRLGWELV
jgi:hypothetical protein